MSKAVVAIFFLAVLGGASFGEEDPAAQSFDRFCGEWMQKLAARESFNRSEIQWQVGAHGVTGEYVGYSIEHHCKLVEPSSPGSARVGEIMYREMRYRQSGGSTARAAQSVPRVVELTEVTEIFRYAEGKWVY